MSKYKNVVTENPKFVVLDEIEGVDIDTELDFQVAEILYNKINDWEVIAEIGWNHCGDMELAKQMILQQRKVVQLTQSFKVGQLVDSSRVLGIDDGRREIYEKAELTKERHIELINYCDEVGIKFMSSVFSIKDAELLVELGVEDVKIPSFESRNHDLIKYCDKNFKTVFMSTGTSTFNEIKDSQKREIL